MKVKALADSHIDKGDFEEWAKNFYENYLKTSASKPTYARLEKTVGNGSVKYIVKGSYLKNPYRLGTYPYEEAVKVKALADSHIDAGDFVEWSKKFYDEYKKNNIRKRTNNIVVYARIDKFVKHGKVEHAFKYIKDTFNFRKVRYRGLAKNFNKLNVLFACANGEACSKKFPSDCGITVPF